MNAFKNLWAKLSRSKKYREEFVAAEVKRGIPFQIRALMKNKQLSQEKLAEQAGLTQGVISRAANPDYGNLTLNTLIRIAAGFDMAFVGRFVPFSELTKWVVELDEDKLNIPTFEEENLKLEKEEPEIAAISRAINELTELIKAETERIGSRSPRIEVKQNAGATPVPDVRRPPAKVYDISDYCNSMSRKATGQQLQIAR